MMATFRTTLTLLTISCMTLAVSPGAMSQAATANATQSTAQQEQRARDYFTNLELINQDGETVRFFDDVLKDKVVVISFIFTNCEGACPLITHKLTQVRDRMEGQIGDPIHFVSLSIDPKRDTPAALKEFARTHHADHEGWVFLTGKPEHLQEITSSLGQFTDDIEMHSTLMLAGNVKSAHWIKIPPQDQAPSIVEKLKLLVEDNDNS